MATIQENKLGGLFLGFGALVILVTIYFEYNIGWIGVERAADEVPLFIYQSWSSLKNIWGWQMLGHASLIIAYFLFLKKANALMLSLWSILLLCGFMIVVAFGFTLGSYFPALEVYDTQPELFQTIRGGIGSLYRVGRVEILLLALLFVYETFRKNGLIHRMTGALILILILSCMIIGTLAGIDPKVTGATVFFLPLTMGYFFWKT